MRAQVSLTPTESKKLLAKALAEMVTIKEAMEKGLVVIHPSSTTLFLIEELTGKRPQGLWVCGMIIPEGACVSREQREAVKKILIKLKGRKRDPGQFPFSWVFEKGSFKTGLPLASLLDKMDKQDVYVKGANAIDPQGKAGVLYAGIAAGTFGKVIKAFRNKGFAIVLPTGLEKLIPTPIEKAAKYASRTKMDVAMGIPVGLIPSPGEVVTEVEAIHILSGAEAVIVGAGGIDGAEGSVTLVIKGSKKNVTRSYQIIEAVKGATLPKIYPTDCGSCPFSGCHFNTNFKAEN